MGFLEYHWYLGEKASLWVTKLGQARKEGIVVADIVPPQPTSALVECHAPTSGGVATDAVHGRAARWPAISMANSSGSASNSDVGCRLTAMIAGVDVTRYGARGGQSRARAVAWMELRHVCGWNYGVWTVVRQRAGEAVRRDQLTLIAEEAMEAVERGL